MFEGGETARRVRSLGSSRPSSAQERSGPVFLGPPNRGGMLVVVVVVVVEEWEVDGSVDGKACGVV